MNKNQSVHFHTRKPNRKTTFVQTLLPVVSLFVGLLLLQGCRKNTVVPAPTQVNRLVTLDGIVFDTMATRKLNLHPFGFDTQQQPYTLSGYGCFDGKTRIVQFTNGGTFRQVPVVKASGFGDYGYTYLARDTAGTIWEIYQQRFGTSDYSWPVPLTPFSAARLAPATQWTAWAGYEQGKNTTYFQFAAQVISLDATTSKGVTGCIEIAYKAPDYADTLFIKPGKGPLEVRSWRSRLAETGQPGTGGYR